MKTLEKSLWAKDKSENPYWVPVIFVLLGSTALKTDTILSFKWKLHWLRNPHTTRKKKKKNKSLSVYTVHCTIPKIRLEEHDLDVLQLG